MARRWNSDGTLNQEWPDDPWDDEQDDGDLLDGDLPKSRRRPCEAGCGAHVEPPSLLAVCLQCAHEAYLNAQG